MPDLYESRKSFQQAWAGASSVPLNIADDGRVDLQEHEYPGGLLQEVLHQKGLSSRRRLDAYRTQYWFRLISILQQEMPITLHLLGYTPFNRLAQEYISIYPTPGGMLSHIGRHWLNFIKSKIQDKQIIQASEVDRAYYEVFTGSLDTRKTQALTLETLQKAAEGAALKLAMPDNVRMISLDYDLLALRETLLQSGAAQQARMHGSKPQDKIQRIKQLQTRHYLIFRQDTRIHTLPLRNPSGVFFAAIQQDQNWEKALEAYSEVWIKENPDTTQRDVPIGSLFQEVTAKGWLAQRL